MIPSFLSSSLAILSQHLDRSRSLADRIWPDGLAPLPPRFPVRSVQMSFVSFFLFFSSPPTPFHPGPTNVCVGRGGKGTKKRPALSLSLIQFGKAASGKKIRAEQQAGMYTCVPPQTHLTQSYPPSYYVCLDFHASSQCAFVPSPTLPPLSLPRPTRELCFFLFDLLWVPFPQLAEKEECVRSVSAGAAFMLLLPDQPPVEQRCEA